MNESPYCSLRFLYQDRDGLVHCTADCGPCFTVEYADNIGGPWFFERDGTAGDDIVIEPLTFYRAKSRDCDPGEIEEITIPTPIAPPEEVK